MLNTGCGPGKHCVKQRKPVRDKLKALFHNLSEILKRFTFEQRFIE